MRMEFTRLVKKNVLLSLFQSFLILLYTAYPEIPLGLSIDHDSALLCLL
jgi:hypothetical protein